MSRESLRSPGIRGVLRFLLALVGPLVVLWGVTMAFMALNESSYIYFPAPLPPGVDPGRAGLAFEDVELVLDGETTVHGWWLPGPGDAAAPAVLFFHGNAGSLAGRIPLFERLLRLPVPPAGVLAIDYPGYGRSTGRPSERALHASARLAREHLARHRGIPPDRLILYGRSLGAAVALHSATALPPAGLVLEVPFLSVPALARVHYPFLPGLGLLVRQRFDNERAIARLTAPLLVLFGTADTIVPPSHPRRLAGLSPTPTTLVPLPGAGHDDTWTHPTWTPAWTRFLRQLGFPPGRPPEARR